MISALVWVPKGVAKAIPVVAEPSEEELAALRQQLESEQADADESGDDDEDEDDQEQSDSEEMAEDEGPGEAVARARAAAAAIAASRQAGSSGPTPGSEGIESALRELDMEHYDDSDNDQDLVNRVLGTSGRGNIEYVDAEGDPYVTLEDEDNESEIDDFTIRPTDQIVLSAKNEDDVSSLEVWIYEEADGNGDANLYVHHDIMLPAFPLCLSWLDCDPSGSSEKRNLVAIGTLDPAIEIWDLDVVDAVEPLVTLGGVDKSPPAPTSESSESDKKKKKKKKKSKVQLVPGSHQDSVLGLSWNREYRNVLASASADMTVKVWDLVKHTCEHTLSHHTDKVQAVAWNPAESPVLLTGSFDRTVCLVDARTPKGDPVRWQVSADVEALTWNPHQPTSFVVASEDGIVAAYDARGGAGSAALFRLSAHDKPTCTLSFCPAAAGLLATGSTDKKIKLWDLRNQAPALVATQDLDTGAVFSAGFCADAPYLLAAGGAKGEVSVWDTRAHPQVEAAFPGLSRWRPGQGAVVAAGQHAQAA